MTDNFLRAGGVQFSPDLIAGIWKFRDVRKHKFGVTTGQLAKTAIEMVNERIGQGTFLHVYVRGTGDDEIGICFKYRPTKEELSEIRELREAFDDFFKRRHGGAVKGWDICTGITEITLES